MNTNDLIDIWGLLNKNKVAFSRKSVIKGILKQTRIDLCLISRNIVRWINTIDYRSSHISGNDPIILTLKDRQITNKFNLWCFNNSLLEDKKYINIINKQLDYIN